MTEPMKFATTDKGFRSTIADTLGVSLVATAARVILPNVMHSRLSVLIFHRILPEPDPLLPYEITFQQFRKEMEALAKHFTILPMEEGLRRLHDGTLPPFSLCLTFDDGYRDNYTFALPVLRELGVRATFFIASGYLDSGIMWNDALLEIVRRWPDDEIDLSDWGIPRYPVQSLESRRNTWRYLFKWMRRVGHRGRSELLERLSRGLPSALATDLMLTTEQVRELHAEGMEIGCHTRSHPILSGITEERVREEIQGSRNDLEELIQAPVRYFAYPNGVPGDDYGQREVAIVADCGFDAAFSTAWGVVTNECDTLQLPRFTPWDKSITRFIMRFILSRKQVSPLSV